MDKPTFTFRDLVWLVTLVLGMAATYFTMQADIKTLKEKTDGLNMELINYRMNEISIQLDKILEVLE